MVAAMTVNIKNTTPSVGLSQLCFLHTTHSSVVKEEDLPYCSPKVGCPKTQKTAITNTTPTDHFQHKSILYM